MADGTTTENEKGYAQGWKPQPGDRLVGTVVDITSTDMGYGPYAIVTLKTANGEVAVHAFHTVLRRELARRRPTVGDDLDITYLGKQGGRDRGYDGYRVRSSKDAVGYDWSRDLPGEDMSAVEEPPIPVAPQPAATPAVAAAQQAENDEVPF